jgi:hypothetical protein
VASLNVTHLGFKANKTPLATFGNPAVVHIPPSVVIDPFMAKLNHDQVNGAITIDQAYTLLKIRHIVKAMPDGRFAELLIELIQS